jgi:hypothetical protein
LNGNESNSTDSKGRNCSSSRESIPELNYSNRSSGTDDAQTESCWQFMLSLEFDDLTALQQSHLQSNYTDFFQLHASDYTVTSYPELEASEAALIR